MDSKGSYKKTVVVVGGGVAGLACALKLASIPTFKVTLLEGSDRIGGRVNSINFGGNETVELGAQWVHGEKENNIYSLVKPYDVLEDEIAAPKFHSKKLAVFVTQCGEFLSEAFHEKIMFLMHTMQPTAAVATNIKEDESLGEFASQIFWKFHTQTPIHDSEAICTGILDWIHRFQNSVDGAESWFVTSSRGQLHYKTCEGNPTISWKRPANYTTLIQILLDGGPAKEKGTLIRHPRWIHLKKEVKSIMYGGDETEVTVHCQDGTVYTCDYVVSTVSLGVLKETHAKLFQPLLPHKKINAIENLGFGVVDKIFLEFSTAWWPENSFGFNLVWENCGELNTNWLLDATPSILCQEDESGIPAWCRSLLGFYTLKNHHKTLFTWITGPPAIYMESMATEVLKIQLVKVLRKFVGAKFVVPDPISIMRSAWNSNVYTRGSYSFRTVRSEEKGATAAGLAEPIFTSLKKPVLCFAGEATHSCFYSTVHGAYDSGIREADRIINHTKENADM